MRNARTDEIGMRTGRLSRTSVGHKDPQYDYCFKRGEDVADGIVSQEGWEPVQGPNTKETWLNKYAEKAMARTKGNRQLKLGDTILCRREKEATAYFNEIVNDKRRAQARLIREATRNNRRALQKIDPDARIKDSSSITGSFTQKMGPNMEVDGGES